MTDQFKDGHCYICGIRLEGNVRSSEHVILQAIGGRIQSSKLLCKEHNGVFGRTIDLVVLNQLQPLVEAFNPKRSRTKEDKRINYFDQAGQKYSVLSGRKPTWTVTFSREDGTAYNVTYNSQAEAERDAEKQVQRYRAKMGKPPAELPKIVWNDLEDKVFISTESDGRSVSGGVDYFRCILKTAINFYCYHGHERSYIKYAITALQSENETLPVSFIYPPPINYKGNEVLHVLALRGSKDLGCLYCYVELLSADHCIAILNPGYNGPEINVTYAYNIQTSMLQENVELRLDYDAPTLRYLPFQKFLVGQQQLHSLYRQRLIDILQQLENAKQ